ncbi:MAG: hypothetical protein N4A61_13060 [Pelagimonas sp.]|jgi:hypothetical protein|nr:hypothetical protein [Pelagimonas sp.]
MALQRLSRSVEFRVDKYTTAARNARLDAEFARDPQRVLEQIDSAITRGAAWFEPQSDVSMSVLYCALGTLQRSGDARLEFVYPQMEYYRTSVRDPAFRVLDMSYDDQDPRYAALPDIMEVRPYFPVELMMIDTAWADKRDTGDVLARLASFDDQGGYGSTHIVIGGLILLNNGGADPDKVHQLIAPQIPVIAAANDRTTRAEDLYAERCMVLQWYGRSDLVRPAWMMRLLRRQLPDGGWSGRNIAPEGQSNQHTSVLALAALTYFLAQHRGTLAGGA